MSGNTTRRAARSLGGMIMQPPITREAAGEHFGAEITAESWSEICRAFAQYGFVLDDLKASRASKSKDPNKASWHERQKNTVKALEAALDRLQVARKHRRFLHEASENYSLVTLNRSAGADLDAANLLDEAFKKILYACVMIERAEPQIVEVPTEANARAMLVRAIAEALTKAGIKARASTGRSLDSVTDPNAGRNARISDLTLFEQFLDLLGIGEEMTVKSFSEFVRSSISKKTKKGG